MEKRTELGFPIPQELEEYKPGDPRPLSASELRVLNMSRKSNNLPLVEPVKLEPGSRWAARPKDSVFTMPESRDNTEMLAQRPKGSKCFYMMGEMEDQSDTGVQYIIELKDLWRPCTWLAAHAIERLQHEGGEWGPRVKGVNGFEGESDTWVEVGPYKRYPIDTSLEDIPDGLQAAPPFFLPSLRARVGGGGADSTATATWVAAAAARPRTRDER